MRTTTTPSLALVLPVAVSLGGLVWMWVRGVSVFDVVVFGVVVAAWAVSVWLHRESEAAAVAGAEAAAEQASRPAPEPVSAAPSPVVPEVFAPAAPAMDIEPLTASMRSSFGATKDTMNTAGQEIDRCQTLMHESVEGLLVSFSGLKDQAQRQRALLVDLIAQLAGTDESGRGVLPRFIQETDIVMRDFVDYIVSVSKQSMAMTTRIADITEQMERIQSVTIRARQLARSTSLLALNAKIEAAQAGRHAAGFGVIADEVQALAKESHDFNEQISGLVSGVRRKIDETETAIGGLASRDMNQAIQARSRADELGREVEQLSEHMQGSLEEVSVIADHVDGAVADAVRALQFDDIVRQVLQHSAFILQQGQDLSIEMSRLLEWQEDPADIAAQVEQRLIAHRSTVEAQDRAVEQESMDEGAIELF